MYKTPSNPMSDEVAAIMPKAVEIMAAATISDRDDFKSNLFIRAMHAAIVTAVTGIETPLVVTPEIQDGVIIGFSMQVEWEVINSISAEKIMSDVVKTVIFNANYDYEQERKSPDFTEFLEELFGNSDDELAEESASGDDVSKNPVPSEDKEQKPSEQIAS